MLGDNLLVAPIFNDESKGIFYLPKGTWTDFFTGEVMEGSAWIEKEYDYLHLPLMVKENSIVAMGACDDKPDYDYADEAELRVYALSEDKEASTVIYDMKQNVALTASVVKKGSKITIQVQADKPYTVRLINMKAVSASGADMQMEGNDTILTPTGGAVEVEI